MFVSNQDVNAMAHGRFTSRHGYDWNNSHPKSVKVGLFRWQMLFFSQQED